MKNRSIATINCKNSCLNKPKINNTSISLLSSILKYGKHLPPLPAILLHNLAKGTHIAVSRKWISLCTAYKERKDPYPTTAVNEEEVLLSQEMKKLLFAYDFNIDYSV